MFSPFTGNGVAALYQNRPANCHNFDHLGIFRAQLGTNRAVYGIMRADATMKGGDAMLRIAIVEDDALQRGQLAAGVRAFLGGLESELVLVEAAQPLLARYDAGERFDLLLLDIQLPGIDGMSAAARVRRLDADAVIVFITSMAQYAVQGYKVDALDFLVKPVQQEMLDACLSRALRRLRRLAPASLSVRCGADLRIVPVSSILYAESREHRTLLCTQEEEIPCAGSLGSMEEALVPHGFFRCHAAFVVSFSKVERLDGGDIVAGGRHVPLSKHRRKQFLAALAAYWGDKG